MGALIALTPDHRVPENREVASRSHAWKTALIVSGIALATLAVLAAVLNPFIALAIPFVLAIGVVAVYKLYHLFQRATTGGNSQAAQSGGIGSTSISSDSHRHLPGPSSDHMNPDSVGQPSQPVRAPEVSSSNDSGIRTSHFTQSVGLRVNAHVASEQEARYMPDVSTQSVANTSPVSHQPSPAPLASDSSVGQQPQPERRSSTPAMNAYMDTGLVDIRRYAATIAAGAGERWAATMRAVREREAQEAARIRDVQSAQSSTDSASHASDTAAQREELPRFTLRGNAQVQEERGPQIHRLTVIASGPDASASTRDLYVGDSSGNLQAAREASTTSDETLRETAIPDLDEDSEIGAQPPRDSASHASDTAAQREEVPHFTLRGNAQVREERTPLLHRVTVTASGSDASASTSGDFCVGGTVVNLQSAREAATRAADAARSATASLRMDASQMSQVLPPHTILRGETLNAEMLNAQADGDSSVSIGGGAYERQSSGSGTVSASIRATGGGHVSIGGRVSVVQQ